jgi:hypothetical protein
MKRNTILLLFLSLLMSAYAQNSFQNPINIGIKSDSFNYLSDIDTRNYTNNYTGWITNDVFYQFTLTCAMRISIHTNSSEMAFTYSYLFDSSGNLVPVGGLSEPEEEYPAPEYAYYQADIS